MFVDVLSMQRILGGYKQGNGIVCNCCQKEVLDLCIKFSLLFFLNQDFINFSKLILPTCCKRSSILPDLFTNFDFTDKSIAV